MLWMIPIKVFIVPVVSHLLWLTSTSNFFSHHSGHLIIVTIWLVFFVCFGFFGFFGQSISFNSSTTTNIQLKKDWTPYTTVAMFSPSLITFFFRGSPSILSLPASFQTYLCFQEPKWHSLFCNLFSYKSMNFLSHLLQLFFIFSLCSVGIQSQLLL